MKRGILFIMVLIIVFGLTVACPPRPAPVVPPDPVKPLDPLEEELRPMLLSIGTGGVGGIFFPLGGGVAEVINRNIPGLRATAEVTAGSVANMRMVQRGDMELALSMDDVTWAAYHGKGVFAAEGKLDNLRALFQMYPNYFQIVTLRDLPIYSMADLRGRRVSIGAPASGTAVKFTSLITALGMTLDDFKVSRLSFAEQVTALRDGTIDVGSWSVGLGAASIIDIATTHDIRIIPVSPAEQKKISAAHPFYFAGIIPRGTYRGIDADVSVMYVGNTMIAHKDVQYRAAYEIVRAVFDPENLAFLRTVHRVAEETVLERAAMVPIPLHPGAERFFREKGVLK
jgi:TRAP transporter TAXI family solute receptor